MAMKMAIEMATAITNKTLSTMTTKMPPTYTRLALPVRVYQHGMGFYAPLGIINATVEMMGWLLVFVRPTWL
jgi:hypothetical protein